MKKVIVAGSDCFLPDLYLKYLCIPLAACFIRFALVKFLVILQKMLVRSLQSSVKVDQFEMINS